MSRRDLASEAVGVGLAAALAFAFSPSLGRWFLRELPARDRGLRVFSGATNGLELRLLLALAAGLLVTMPELVWRGWRALSPDPPASLVRARERLLGVVTVVLAGAIVFAYDDVLPWYERSFGGAGARLGAVPEPSAVVRSGVLVVLVTVVVLEVPVFLAGLRRA